MSPPRAVPALPSAMTRLDAAADMNTSPGAVAAIVVATAPAADERTRPLLWLPVAGRPLIAWPLRALAQLDPLGFCAVITSPAHKDDALMAIQDAAPARVSAVIPTASRSWRRALATVSDIPATCEWIIALDAAQPLVTAAGLREGLRVAQRTGVAIAGEPVKETLKHVARGLVTETPPRASLTRLSAPAIFRREALEHALAAAPANATDAVAGADVEPDLVTLAQRAGVPLVAFDAGSQSLCVTSEADLAIVETLLSQRPPEAL